MRTVALTAVAAMAWAGLAVVASGGSGGPWRPAGGTMLTPWALDVDPDAPLPEYPRPSMRRDEWKNLNGLWEYAITSRDAGEPTSWDGRILVPFPVESALSGVARRVGPGEALWYRRAFVPVQRGADRLLLHVGASDWETTVIVNGRVMGHHRGGYDPFTVDITEALSGVGEQTLVVRVWDPTDAGLQARGKQTRRPGGIFYTPVTGIWQTVWLEPVPPSHVRGLRLRADPDAGTLTVLAEVANPGGTLVRATAGRSRQTGISSPGEPVTVRLDPGEHRRWTPEEPWLHTVEVEVLRGSRVVDRVWADFAVRTIERRADASGVERLHLNGEPVFMLGLLDQGWWPDGLYTAPTDEALRHDLEMTRRMGFNLIRKHVKVEPKRWYHHADRLGLLVWQDMPSLLGPGAAVQAGAARDGTLGELDRAQFREELRAMVATLANHPSIVAWVPFNEGWGQHDTNEVLAYVRSLDPTRPVGGPSGWEDRGVGDLHDMHAYPGPSMHPPSAGRASVLGEFGGLGLPIAGHLWQQRDNWGYRTYEDPASLLAAYESLIARLETLAIGGLAGAVYTQTTDVEGEVNGLMTYDRRVTKLDPDRLASMHRRVIDAASAGGSIRTIVASSAERGQAWRYTLADPGSGWMRPGFDDAGWSVGEGGFGTPQTPNTSVRTRWDTPVIWLRRTVRLPALGGSRVGLWIHHDEDTVVYVNGVEAARLSGYTGGPVPVLLGDAASGTLVEGENLLAIRTTQTGGGQYIDAGLFAIDRASVGR